MRKGKEKNVEEPREDERKKIINYCLIMNYSDLAHKDNVSQYSSLIKPISKYNYLSSTNYFNPKAHKTRPQIKKKDRRIKKRLKILWIQPIKLKFSAVVDNLVSTNSANVKD